MARIATVKNNMAKGELDPLIHERFDVELWHQALRKATNAIVIPQGGAEKRDGMRSKFRARRRLRRQQLKVVGGYDPGVTLTAVNGGTTANAIDQSEGTEFRTTASATAGATLEVIRLELSEAIDLVFVDVVAFSAQTAGLDKGLYAQTSDDGLAWTDFGAPFNIRTTARTRRFAAGSGGAQATTRFIRIVVKNTSATALGTIGFKEIALWTETGRVSPVRRLQFSFDAEQTYLLWMTDHNIDVMRAGEWQCAIPVPHRVDQVMETTKAQSRDAMMIFHGDVAPHMVFRQGAHDEFDSTQQTFSNIPSTSSGTTFGVAQDEVQRVVIDGLATGGWFTLWAENVHSIPIQKSGTAATTASNILAALGIVPGATVAVVGETATRLEFLVTFTGASGGRVWAPLGVDTWSDSAEAIVETVQDGRAASGAYMSATTGWPRCGTFHQSRLALGGFKLRPETFILSVLGLYFDFDQNVTTYGPAAGMEFALDSDEVAVIVHLFSGRHLQIFTKTSEWFATERTVDAEKVFPLSNTSRNGAKDGGDVLLVEGSTLFVQATGNVVRENVYSDVDQSYDAPAATLLASHLVNDIQSMDYRRSATTSEGSQIYIVNGDGSGAIMSLLKAEKVRAITPWRTAGLIRAVGVDGQRRVYAAVERTSGAGTDVWFEEIDPDSILDASQAFAHSSPQARVTGLERLEGLEVWAVADGQIVGPMTVVDAAIELPKPATSGEVGRFFDWQIEPLPPVETSRDGKVIRRARRVHDVTLSLYATTEIAISANGGPVEEVPLREIGGATLDRPPLAYPYTGDARVEGLLGYMEGATVTVTQIRPGRATLRAIYMEAS